MEDQLHLRLTLLLKLRVKRPLPIREFRVIDIALLKARNFLQGAKYKDIVIKYTSLYKIDQLIKNKKGQDILPNNKKEFRQLIYKKLLQPYQEHTDCFSKTISNTLPLYYRGVDHNIIFKGNSHNLALSPLYNILLEQLELVKAYLQEYL